jgi:hypothetical protein
VRKEKKMHNQHLGFSRVAAGQRMAERRVEATEARLAKDAGPSPRWDRFRPVRRWWRRLGWSRPATARPRRAGDAS